MPQDHSLLDAPNVLKAETVKLLMREPLRVQKIADRWASGSPKKVRQFEASGTLFPKLREQAQLEAEMISDAKMGGRFSDVPDSEILAMYEIPLLP